MATSRQQVTLGDMCPQVIIKPQTIQPKKQAHLREQIGKRSFLKGQGSFLGGKVAIGKMGFPQQPTESRVLLVPMWVNNAWCVTFPQFFPIYVKSIINF